MSQDQAAQSSVSELEDLLTAGMQYKPRSRAEVESELRLLFDERSRLQQSSNKRVLQYDEAQQTRTTELRRLQAITPRSASGPVSPHSVAISSLQKAMELARRDEAAAALEAEKDLREIMDHFDELLTALNRLKDA